MGAVETFHWKCHAFGTLHPGGPQQCADPSRGGVWLGEEVDPTGEIILEEVRL